MQANPIVSLVQPIVSIATVNEIKPNGNPKKQNPLSPTETTHTPKGNLKQAAACTATELRARAAPVVGTSFLLVILRRDYSRAFPRQARIACGNNFPFGKIREQDNTERIPKKRKTTSPPQTTHTPIGNLKNKI